MEQTQTKEQSYEAKIQELSGLLERVTKENQVRQNALINQMYKYKFKASVLLALLTVSVLLNIGFIIF